MSSHQPTSAKSEQLICDKLVAKGQELLKGPPAFVQFAGTREADELINDLDNHPHAFVIACIMDRQVRSELAWQLPYRLSQRLGDFSLTRLRQLSLEEILQLMTKPKPLHRLTSKMSRNLHEAIRLLDDNYGGNAARIWSDRPSSAALVYRFLEFRGIGPKIATMAANILARDFKIPMKDYYSIDISADVHVKRVFTRLGLISKGASTDQIIYRSRELYPEFPGIMDLPVWEIGRQWCRPRKPLCEQCYMQYLCPTSLQQHES
ncbi:iron-sulfur cluster loop [Acidobacteria bacterium AH-259-D05]|nr:iron-sulfur cluster loop [Acidobacteria bacterium AH-259-D05]